MGSTLLSEKECFVISVTVICKLVCQKCLSTPTPALRCVAAAFVLVICTCFKESPVEER